MDNQNRKLELLGNAPIPKALLAMGIPTMIYSLLLEKEKKGLFLDLADKVSASFPLS